MSQTLIVTEARGRKGHNEGKRLALDRCDDRLGVARERRARCRITARIARPAQKLSVELERRSCSRGSAARSLRIWTTNQDP